MVVRLQRHSARIANLLSTALLLAVIGTFGSSLLFRDQNSLPFGFWVVVTLGGMIGTVLGLSGESDLGEYPAARRMRPVYLLSAALILAAFGTFGFHPLFHDQNSSTYGYSMVISLGGTLGIVFGLSGKSSPVNCDS